MDFPLSREVNVRITTWILAGALMVAGCKRGSSPNATASPASNLAARAAAAITQGRLAPNKEGIVDLPPAMQSVSANQKAYVRKESDGTLWVFLPETTDASFKGQLFCSKPPASPPAKVQIIGPKPGGGAGPVQVTVDGTAPEGWYTVHAGG